MILDIIYYTFFALFSGFLFYFPSLGSLPAGLESMLGYLLTFMANLAYVIPPLQEMFIVFGLIVLIEFYLASFKILNWVLNKLRGSG